MRILPRQADQQSQILSLLLVGSAVALFGWSIYLGSVLHGQVQVRDWQVAWVGLDLMQASGLAASGVLLAQHRRLLSPVAAASACLMLVDAWFDVLTSEGGASWYIALLMACALEVPAAFLLVWLSKQALDW
ncbi:MAG TPA: hypothetical protein VLL08_01940 [Kineosporiaceae bacterium]|nr:hypothetical protein [Kineosporiaceae bacterium]